jgi:hypothetical protein
LDARLIAEAIPEGYVRLWARKYMHLSLQFSTTTYQFRPRCRIWLNLSACRWPVLAPPRISSNLRLEATFHAAAFFLGQNILKHNRKKMVFGVVRKMIG